MKNILFICSRNRWRSLTAEHIYKKNPKINVKSAGTENSARIKVNSKMLVWADLIFVMEKHHKEKLHERFPQESENLPIIVLEIPDKYKFMDKELIDEIQISVTGYIE